MPKVKTIERNKKVERRVIKKESAEDKNVERRVIKKESAEDKNEERRVIKKESAEDISLAVANMLSCRGIRLTRDVDTWAKKLKKVNFEALHDWYQSTYKMRYRNVSKHKTQVRERILKDITELPVKGNPKDAYEALNRLIPAEVDFRVKYKNCVGRRISHWRNNTGTWIYNYSPTYGIITEVLKRSIKFKVKSGKIFTARAHFEIDGQ